MSPPWEGECHGETLFLCDVLGIIQGLGLLTPGLRSHPFQVTEIILLSVA